MNKSFPITLALIGFTLIASAKENTRPLKENINKVIVFQSAAQIESSAKAFVDEGVTEIIFENIANTVNRQSIQVSGEGDFTILSVQTEANYLNVQEKPKALLMLEDSLDKYTLLLEQQNIRKYALDQEESLLLVNKTVSSKENIAVDIEDMAELYRTRLPKIKEEQYLTDKKIKKLADIVNRYASEINSQTNLQNSSDVVVTISAKNATNIQLNLTYIVYNVGWTPIYDIRSNNIKSNVNIVYKANVYQNTGIDWKNVKLVLSTGNPTVNGVKPTMNPWYMAFVNPFIPFSGSIPSQYGDASGGVMNYKKPLIGRSAANEVYIDGAKVSEAASAPETEVNENQFSRTFEIAAAYTVPSNGQPKTVEISNYSIVGQYEYITIPKLDQRAFLVANITDWEKFNLIPGKANVFFEDAFVGETFLNTQVTDDTLQVSLGSDKGIVVKRDKVNEMSSTKTVGSNKKVSLTYEISIRNTKNTEVSIVIEDQVPVSQNQDIEVKVTDKNNAQYDETTGKLKWPLKIAAGETQKVRFTFEVKYPKNKLVNGL